MQEEEYYLKYNNSYLVSVEADGTPLMTTDESEAIKFKGNSWKEPFKWVSKFWEIEVVMVNPYENDDTN